jgi:hypothetical protein
LLEPGTLDAPFSFSAIAEKLLKPAETAER